MLYFRQSAISAKLCKAMLLLLGLVNVHIFAQMFTVCMCERFSNWCQKNMALASSITTPYLGGGFVWKHVKYGLLGSFREGYFNQTLSIHLFLWQWLRLNSTVMISFCVQQVNVGCWLLQEVENIEYAKPTVCLSAKHTQICVYIFHPRADALFSHSHPFFCHR